MKTTPLILVAAVLALCASTNAPAQCSVGYAPSFSLWEDMSADATNLYTRVGIDGSGTMTIEGQCYGLPSIYHWALLWNSIGGVGNTWVPFGNYCPDCYVSEEQDDILPYDPNQTYTFTYGGEMWCNIGGMFFDADGLINVELAYTKSKWTQQYSTAGGGAVTCYVTQWCTVATQPPACNPSYVIQEPLIYGQDARCWLYYNTNWLAERLGDSGPWNCVPLLPGQNAIGTTDSSVASCTKQ